MKKAVPTGAAFLVSCSIYQPFWQMIDGVKITIFQPGYAEWLRHNSRLTFQTPIDDSTGEYINRIQTTTFEGMKIWIDPLGRVHIRGSIHKLANAGRHNWNDFTYPDLCRLIDSLADTLGCDPQKMEVHGLEFGVNVVLPESTASFLRRLVVYQGRVPDRRTYGGKGNSKTIELDRYAVKVYCKSSQYSEAPRNLLRFEVKVLKMCHLHGVGVNTLFDLLDRGKLEQLGVVLQKAYTGLLVDERLDMKTLTVPQRKIIGLSMSNEFWENSPDRKQRHRVRQRYEQICQEKGIDCKARTGLLIESKWAELMRV